MSKLAHTFHDKVRTGDVIITENIDFSSLLLSERVLKGLNNAGFVKPSPIQLKAIPLGRCGLDLIVQAKSGTGKTCVFSVVALESILLDTASTQVLVLAPTREIAVQIWEVINSIGSAMPGLQCHTFIGGLPVQEDRVKLKKCHIAVGSPGRIKQLIEAGVLKTDSVRLFVLDEADKLLEEGFQEQINWIYSTLPENKQMLALSATYPEHLATHLTAYMRNPTFLRLNISDPALLGIRQYYKTVPYHPISHAVFEEKSKILSNILSSVSFQQCLVFSNLQTRAQNLADILTSHGWPTACIAGCLDQKDRNEAMAKLKTYKCRILISTDLTSRGIDADKVNMVINLDVPKDHETYLHRIGRAGRFGSFGIAISLVSDGQEKINLDSIEKRCNTQICPLPDPLPSDLAKPDSPIFLDDVVSTEVINTENSRPSLFHTPSKVINTENSRTSLFHTPSEVINTENSRPSLFHTPSEVINTENSRTSLFHTPSKVINTENSRPSLFHTPSEVINTENSRPSLIHTPSKDPEVSAQCGLNTENSRSSLFHTPSKVITTENSDLLHTPSKDPELSAQHGQNTENGIQDTGHLSEEDGNEVNGSEYRESIKDIQENSRPVNGNSKDMKRIRDVNKNIGHVNGDNTYGKEHAGPLKENRKRVQEEERKVSNHQNHVKDKNEMNKFDDADGRELVSYEGFEHTDSGSTIEWGQSRRRMLDYKDFLRNEDAPNVKNNNTNTTSVIHNVKTEIAPSSLSFRSAESARETSTKCKSDDDNNSSAMLSELLENDKSTNKAADAVTPGQPAVCERKSNSEDQFMFCQVPRPLELSGHESQTINIPEMFKHNTGYRKITVAHSYSSARESLMAFRNIDYSEIKTDIFAAGIHVPKSYERRKENDILKVAISQLQDILENGTLSPKLVLTESTKFEPIKTGVFESIVLEDQLQSKEFNPEVLVTDQMSENLTKHTVSSNELRNRSYLKNVTLPQNCLKLKDLEIEMEKCNIEKITSSSTILKSPEVKKKAAQRPRKQRLGYQGNFAIGHLLEAERDQSKVEHEQKSGDAEREAVEKRVPKSDSHCASAELLSGTGDATNQQEGMSGRLGSQSELIFTEDLSENFGKFSQEEIPAPLVKDNTPTRNESSLIAESKSSSATLVSDSRSNDSKITGSKLKNGEPFKYQSNGAKPKVKKLSKKSLLKKHYEQNRKECATVASNSSESRSKSPSVDSGMYSRPSYQDQWHSWYKQYSSWYQYQTQMSGYNQYHPGHNPWSYPNIANTRGLNGGLSSAWAYQPSYLNQQQPFQYGYPGATLDYSDLFKIGRNTFDMQTEYIKEMSSQNGISHKRKGKKKKKKT